MNQELTKEPRIIVGTMRLGSWGANLNTEGYQHFIEGCLEMGLTTFDHADIYGGYTTEAEFGEVLKQQPSLRGRMKLMSKCGIKMSSHHRIKSYDTSEAHVTQSVENSLRNLHTDHLDMLLIHRPDYLLDVDQLGETFEKLRDAGKVREFGVSNFTPSQFEMLNDVWEVSTNQVEVSLIQRSALEDGTIDQCYRNELKPQAWSPLGGGAAFDIENNVAAAGIAQVAAELGYSVDLLLYAWLLKHPSGIRPVTGTSKLDRLEKAVHALDIELNTEEWYMLLEAAAGEEVA